MADLHASRTDFVLHHFPARRRASVMTFAATFVAVGVLAPPRALVILPALRLDKFSSAILRAAACASGELFSPQGPW